MTDHLIDRKQLMDILNISDSNERRMRQNGKMPPHLRIGHKVLYRMSAVDQWIVDREKESAS